MSEFPLVSIITVVYNDKVNFLRTLKSYIIQDYPHKEIIVIDGGSSDGTIDVILRNKKHIANWVSEPDGGIYFAMNKGINLAKGDFISFLNAGDYYCSSSVLSSIFKKPDLSDVIYGDILVLSRDLKNTQHLKALDFNISNLLSQGTRVVCHQAFFIKKKLAPYYDTRYKFKAELNWYFDILESNNNLSFTSVNMPLVYYVRGGFGDIHLAKNIYEWIKVVVRRFGIRKFFKHKVYKKIYVKLKHNLSQKNQI